MIHHALSRWLPPSKPVRRPFELIYAADECPPRGALGLLALQQIIDFWDGTAPPPRAVVNRHLYAH